MLFSDTLSVGGGGSPRTPLMRTRSGPSSLERQAVDPQRDVGVGVARAADLVEQLRGHGVDADQPAGAGVLGDDRRPVGVDLGEREARRRTRSGTSVKNAKLPPVAWVPHSMTWPAATAPGERVVVGAAPAEVGGGGPDDHRRVGDPAGDDDVGAGVEAVDDAPRAEVGVGGERGAEAEFGGPADEVVALDVGDVDGRVRAARPACGRRRPGPPG